MIGKRNDMVFSNAVFLFIFLPVVIAGYYILRGKARNYWLLLVSIFFYAWNKPSFTIILLGSIVLNYFGALLVEKAGQTEKRNSVSYTHLTLPTNSRV